MAKIIKHYVINITPSHKKCVHYFETKSKPVVTNDFIHLEVIDDGGVVLKGLNLCDVAEYSIRAIEE